MGGTCSMHGRYGKCIQFWSQNPKGRDHYENLDVDGRKILK